MPNIYASTNDGKIINGLGAWASVRAGSSGNADNNNNQDTSAVQSFYSGRGGGSWGIIRAFFDFDTLGITVAPSSATFKLWGYGGSSADIIAVRSGHSTPSLANGDFDALYGASTALAASDGDPGGSGEGAGTLSGVSGLTYSAEISSWSTSGYNDIALNATALADMASLDTFKICVMEYDHDYLDVGKAVAVNTGWYWADKDGTAKDPYIDYTAGTAAVTDNAVFFGTNF